MHDLIIVGAGGFGREILVWAKHAIATGAQWRIKGFIDDNPTALAKFDLGVSVVGSLTSYRPKPNDIFLCAIGRPSIRRTVHHTLSAQGASFATLIHPTAVVADNVRLGSGVILCPFSLVSANATIGEGTAVYYHSSVDHDSRIGRFCHISAHCDITGAATLGDEVFLGSHASILPGVSIGKSVVVGAGAIVTKSVADGQTVVGVPSHPLARGAR